MTFDLMILSQLNYAVSYILQQDFGSTIESSENILRRLERLCLI